MNKTILAFTDIETTGLKPETHDIIEIGLILAEEERGRGEPPILRILKEREWKVKPEHIERADKTALKINRYNENDWRDAAALSDALSEYAGETADAIMVGHNVAFDHSFLQAAFSNTGVRNQMHMHKIDTLSIAYAILSSDPALPKLSLRALCAHYAIVNERAHTALSDTRATLALYAKLVGAETFPQGGLFSNLA
ncbi:3'-5' exonuclease [bacterium]|nr:3'-5' exonuclease [bacterium]MCI0565696.1 3'-5' exonuclease [bacterium]MCI0679914.1 3'-5' exonuclease [bacterium]